MHARLQADGLIDQMPAAMHITKMRGCSRTSPAHHNHASLADHFPSLPWRPWRPESASCKCKPFSSTPSHRTSPLMSEALATDGVWKSKSHRSKEVASTCCERKHGKLESTETQNRNSSALLFLPPNCKLPASHSPHECFKN